MKKLLIRLFQKWCCQPQFAPFYTHLHHLSLRGLGILNSEGNDITGEEWLWQFTHKTLPIKTIFDVGANTGGYTSDMNVYFPKSQFYCFEPNPPTYKLMQSNLKNSSAILINAAVSQKNGTTKIYDFADNAPLKPTQPTSTMASLYPDVITSFHKQPKKTFTVKSITLDSYCLTHHIPQIDWLKIDTEGHEYAVLKGAEKLISQKKIGLVQFEFNEMNVYSRIFLKDFMQILKDYRFFRLYPQGLLPLDSYRPLTHEIFAFQNIVAIKPAWMKKLPLN